jgi:hypothetical protein
MNTTRRSFLKHSIVAHAVVAGAVLTHAALVNAVEGSGSSGPPVEPVLCLIFTCFEGSKICSGKGDCKYKCYKDEDDGQNNCAENGLDRS